MPRTRIDGLEALWHRDPTRITIHAVRTTTDTTPFLEFPPEHRPDLAEARDRFPDLTPLWNAIRHDFWITATQHDRIY